MAGVTNARAITYDFQLLTQPPTIASVSPQRGPTLGGTAVTIQGTLFGGYAVVSFAERDATGAPTGIRSECGWHLLQDQGFYCNDTTIR